MQKIVGLMLILIGLSMIIFFPFLDRYQPEEMAKTAALIGAILTFAGIFLLKS
jgi:drug/metabolite transporter (DMT)-like permease